MTAAERQGATAGVQKGEKREVKDEAAIGEKKENGVEANGGQRKDTGGGGQGGRKRGAGGEPHGGKNDSVDVEKKEQLLKTRKQQELDRLERRRNNAKKAKRKTASNEQDASSGEEYSDNLMENYIGQVGALAALGYEARDVLSMKMWMEGLDAHERDSLRPHLPPGTPEEQNEVIQDFFAGKICHFGDLRDEAWDYIVAGMTHPRIRRWKQRLVLLQRRRYLQAMRDYHDNFVRQVLARKRPRVGGIVQPQPAVAVVSNDYMDGFDEKRKKRVIDYRKQESSRYAVPEQAFVYLNEWGNSVVAPLKRGPALDGGRPREHPLLKNERPSHVTILCLVRDGASRLPNNEGNRQEICDLLLDSQYVREGASMAQLNQVVSGALDRLHYDDDACVRYDPDTKHWCYLHNDRKITDFKTPSWAKGGKRTDWRKRRTLAEADGEEGETTPTAKQGESKTVDGPPKAAIKGERNAD